MTAYCPTCQKNRLIKSFNQMNQYEPAYKGMPTSAIVVHVFLACGHGKAIVTSLRQYQELLEGRFSPERTRKQEVKTMTSDSTTADRAVQARQAHDVVER